MGRARGEQDCKVGFLKVTIPWPFLKRRASSNKPLSFTEGPRGWGEWQGPPGPSVRPMTKPLTKENSHFNIIQTFTIFFLTAIAPFTVCNECPKKFFFTKKLTFLSRPNKKVNFLVKNKTFFGHPLL